MKTLSARLLVLVATASIPVIVFSSAALWLLAKDKRVAIEQSMLESTRAIGSTMDSQLKQSIALLQTFQASDELRKGDLRGFHEHAKRMAESQPDWLTIALADASGRYMLNVRRPPGDPMPQIFGDSDAARLALKSGRPVVSNLFTGQVSQELLFYVGVPIEFDGKTKYLVAAAVRPSALRRLVDQQRIPTDGIVALSDASGRIVARSRRHDEYLGSPITADLRAAVERQGEGFAELMTLDGQKTYAAFSRSPWSGWTVAVGVPSAAIDGPLARSSLLLMAGVAISVLLGVVSAMLLSRRLTRRILDLKKAADAIGLGQAPRVPLTSIPEIDSMARALQSAADARQAAELDRERLLQSERQARAAAEEANRAKDEFLATLGHELRNPLSAISNGIQVLGKPELSQDVAVRMHGIVSRQVAHLARLIDDLLQVSRVMLGKIELSRSPLELSAHISGVVRALQASGRLEEHSIRLHAGEEIWVNADPHRLEQIMTNLLVNAAKYTPPGRSIDVRVARDGPQALLEVRDEGIGMDAQLTARVFDPFVQGERALDRSQGGLGIGLTLVRRLAELHGGAVEAHSDGAGRGSRFTVSLPALPEKPRRLEPEAQSRAGDQARILVVEDNDDARESLRLLLELSGHTVHTAADGLRGVELAEELAPEVALVDLGLPGMDGYECARRIRRSKGSGIFLIALTGYGLDSDVERARAAGFDLHLTKPASAERLAEALSRRPAAAPSRG